uniref:Uncharacterized protein n=1 Tax=Setaria viridis TaxID=4556 RepID=A0A4U6U4Z1_SETVI|nr:hypothetical protein SEVIR_6G138801v2 [Setaria viridis]
MPPGRKERGRHSLSFLNRSDHFSHSLLFVWGPGLVRFLLLSTQFSVFVRDHLRRKDSLLTPGRRSLCFDSINQYFSTLGNRVSGKNLGQRSLDIKVMGLGWATAS